MDCVSPDEICFQKVKRRKREEQLWEVEEVLVRENDRCLVKWKGWGEEWNSWVCLAANPELLAYLSANEGNPSVVAANKDLPHLVSEERELWLVKHAVFDELQFRRTPEQDSGLERRVQVKVPFSKEAFSSHFGNGTFLLGEARGLDFSGNQNVKFTCTAEEFASVFGADILGRQFSDTSTSCQVDPNSKIIITWGFDVRVNYDHTDCPRCAFVGDVFERPSICTSKPVKLPPISYLKISFKKKRINMIMVRHDSY